MFKKIKKFFKGEDANDEKSVQNISSNDANSGQGIALSDEAPNGNDEPSADGAFIPFSGGTVPPEPPEFKTDAELIAAMVQARAEVELPASGTAGCLRWALSEDHTLTISPEVQAAAGGFPMDDYESPLLRHPEKNAPWLQDNRLLVVNRLVVEEGVTRIGSNAFSCCEFLRSASLPASLTELGAAAFAGCTSLESIVIPDGVTRIPAAAFWRCLSLANVDLPESLTGIEDLAFADCPSLNSPRIPEGVTFIGKNAFADTGSVAPGSPVSLGDLFDDDYAADEDDYVGIDFDEADDDDDDIADSVSSAVPEDHSFEDDIPAADD